MSQSLEDGKIVVVALGSAGSRIASLMSKESLFVDKFLFISCDKSDFVFAGENKKILVETPVGQKLTPPLVRGFALKYLEQIKSDLEEARIVFVISGLGGATGSGLSPLVAELAAELGKLTVSIAVMPFEFEKKLLYNAGVALRWLRRFSKGVIVVDNNNLFKVSSNTLSIQEIYSIANHECVRALSALFQRQNQSNLALGVNKVLSAVVRNGYSLLSISNSESPEKTEEALAGAILSIGKIAQPSEAEKAIIVLDSDRCLPASDVALAVSRFGSMINSNVDVDYTVVQTGASQLQVSIVASGFKTTKYDNFDPLYKIFRGQNLEEQMDIAFPFDSENIEQCEY